MVRHFSLSFLQKNCFIGCKGNNNIPYMYYLTRLFYYYHFILHRNGLGYINKEDGRE